MSPNRLAPVEIPAGQPYVLLIEDEIEDEALAQRILKKYRIANHVDWARDAEDALKLLQYRLGPPSLEEKAPGESSPALAKARAWESGAGGGASLLPAGDSPSRLQDPAPAPAQEAGPGLGTNGNRDNGTERRAKARPPEMVLLDFGQTRIPALEVVRRMRALPGMANVPVALCCRTPEEERTVKESALPRVSCLSKPIGFFKLLECIQKMDMHWFVFSEKP